MPFGLVNAPATFQRAMSFALRGCEDCAIVYIDDILIYSDSREDHLCHLDRVFACLQGQAYHVRLAKCQFLQATVTFLGHRITAQGIEASAAREETLEAFTTPLTRAKQVKSFLGLVMWYKAFIPHAATLAEPLFALTSTKKAFAWTSAAEEVVTTLKQAIVRAPVLARYDPALPTRVTTDASTVGIGAVLEQRHGGVWRPVAFWSRKLKDAETRYSATDLEWLAVVDTVTLVWRHFLEDLSFTLCTDHQALERKLHKSAHDPPVSARQARWIERLMPFALRYEYIKGTENVVADALSRHPRAHLNMATVISAQLAGLLQRMAMASEQDEAYAELKQKTERGEVPGYRLCRGLVQATEGEIVVPRDDAIRTLLLAEAHDSRMGGHFGGARTLEKMRRLWTWRGMAKDVTDYVRSCPKCQATRIDTQRRGGLLMPILAPTPWHTITMDFVGGLEPARVTGRTYCLVIVDKFSKYVLLEPVSATVTAEETAQILIRRVIAAFGVPVKVISDRGSVFTSAVWRETMAILGTSVALAASHHPQTDGQTERTIQTLTRLFRCFAEEQKDEWEKLLPLFQFALNDAHCHATGSTPFRVLFGRDPASPLRFVTGEEARGDPIVPRLQEAELNRRLSTVNEFIRRQQEQVADRMKERADCARRVLVFHEGDLVLLSTKSHPQLAGARKQGRIRVGPFVVRRQVNPNTYVLEGLPPGLPTTQNVSFLTPYHSSPTRFEDRPGEAANEPELVDGELEWEVERVEGFHQQRNGTRRYLVRWAGTPQRQWLPEDEMCHCMRAVRDYFEREGLPLPVPVSEFCLGAEARDEGRPMGGPDV